MERGAQTKESVTEEQIRRRRKQKHGTQSHQPLPLGISLLILFPTPVCVLDKCQQYLQKHLSGKGNIQVLWKITG